MIPLQWFQLFDEREIQVLISGAEVAINVEDLMVNTHYSGTKDLTCTHGGHHLQLALVVFFPMPTSTFTDVHMGMHCNLHCMVVVVIVSV